MNEHVCVWVSSDEWQVEEGTGGWTIEHLRRLKRCHVCGQVQAMKELNRRRRQRRTPDTTRPYPTELRKISAQRWIMLEKLLTVFGGNRLDLEAKLSDWLNAGWVQVEESKEAFRDAWQMEKVCLTEYVYQSEVETPQKKRNTQRQQEMLDALQTLKGREADYQRAKQIWAVGTEEYELVEKLHLLLEEQLQAIENGEWSQIPGTTHRPGSPLHQRWVRIFRGFLARLATSDWEYERGFSARWLGDSKEFQRDRQEIAQYFQISLEQIGLYRHSPVVYCWGPFHARINGQELNGRAGTPFVALTAETVRFMEITEVNADRILIIENQTAFEYLLRTKPANDQSLYLYSGGHAGYGEREWLRKVITSQPDLPWYLWTDWDYGGVRIQMDWEHWATSQGIRPPLPWLWNNDLSLRWKPLGKLLSEVEREKLSKLSHPFSSFLLDGGYSLEQEAMLQDLP